MDQQDNFVLYLVAERLPIETWKAWEISKPEREPQRYDQLKKLFEQRCQALETPSLRSTSIGNQQLEKKRSNMTPKTL